MASRDSQDEASDTCCILSVLPLTKQGKRTNHKKCVLYQEHMEEVLRKTRTSTIETLISALHCRQEEFDECLLPDLEALKTIDVNCHSNCYKTCTSKHNLDLIQKRRGHDILPRKHQNLTWQTQASQGNDRDLSQMSWTGPGACSAKISST